MSQRVIESNIGCCGTFATVRRVVGAICTNRKDFSCNGQFTFYNS